MSDIIYDAVIIGGGPAGLSAAQYASRSNLNTIILDKSATAGALAFTSRIENYPGLTAPVSGKELLDIFRNQAVRFGAKYEGEAQVVGVDFSGDVKNIYTIDKTYQGKTVIIATGSMGRKPTIKGEAEFLGRGVSYCAICDAAFYRGKNVCVVGDSEEAVKEAGLLARFVNTAYLVCPSKKPKVDDDYPALKAENLKVLTGLSVKSIEGDEAVEKIFMTDSEQKTSELEVSGVFVYLHGSQPVVDFLGDNLKLSEDNGIITNAMMETSVPGVFAAGDVLCTDIRQVVVAASSGCLAALSSEKYIHNRKRTKLDWGK